MHLPSCARSFATRPAAVLPCFDWMVLGVLVLGVRQSSMCGRNRGCCTQQPRRCCAEVLFAECANASGRLGQQGGGVLGRQQPRAWHGNNAREGRTRPLALSTTRCVTVCSIDIHPSCFACCSNGALHSAQHLHGRTCARPHSKRPCCNEGFHVQTQELLVSWCGLRDAATGPVARAKCTTTHACMRLE